MRSILNGEEGNLTLRFRNQTARPATKIDRCWTSAVFGCDVGVGEWLSIGQRDTTCDDLDAPLLLGVLLLDKNAVRQISLNSQMVIKFQMRLSRIR